MIILREMDSLPLGTASIATLGTFDGMHLGHQALIAHVVEMAREMGLVSLLLTYDPHPREVLGFASNAVGLLSTIDERIALLEKAGVDYYLIIPFTKEFSNLTAAEFFRRIIIEKINAKHVAVGAGHAFGKDRQGTAQVLMELGKAHGITTTIFPEILLGTEKISSSVIRRLIHAGSVREAATFLGRPYSVSGIVYYGDGLGATLGFRTANIGHPDERKLIPAGGVYIVEAEFDGHRHPGIANIGVRPTISALNKTTLEVHLLNFEGDLYGRTLTISFLDRIRDELKFQSVQQLIDQITADRVVAEAYFQKNSNRSS